MCSSILIIDSDIGVVDSTNVNPSVLTPLDSFESYQVGALGRNEIIVEI